MQHATQRTQVSSRRVRGGRRKGVLSARQGRGQDGASLGGSRGARGGGCEQTHGRRLEAALRWASPDETARTRDNPPPPARVFPTYDTSEPSPCFFSSPPSRPLRPRANASLATPSTHSFPALLQLLLNSTILPYTIAAHGCMYRRPDSPSSRTRRCAASFWKPLGLSATRQQRQRQRRSATRSSARTWPLPRVRPPSIGLAGGRTFRPAGCSSPAARTIGA